jgi:hypothetical protein
MQQRKGFVQTFTLRIQGYPQDRGLHEEEDEQSRQQRSTDQKEGPELIRQQKGGLVQTFTLRIQGGVYPKYTGRLLPER